MFPVQYARLNRPIVHHFIFDHVAVCKPLWYEIVDANLCKLFVNSWKNGFHGNMFNTEFNKVYFP